MFSALVDRIWAPVVCYIALASGIWKAKDIIPSTLAYGLLGVTTVYYAQNIISAISVERRLDALGKRAPRVVDYTPFGLGTLFRAIWYFSHYRNHEFWWKIFLESGNPKNPYTVESITVGERIIFTSDEVRN